MAQVFHWDVSFPEPSVGDFVVISNKTNGAIRPFLEEDAEDLKADSPADIIGTVYPKSGRLTQYTSFFDGPIYALYGPYETLEDLSLPVDGFGAQIPNPAAQPIQPYTDSALKIIATGKIFASMRKPYTPISGMHVVMEHEDFDWVLML
jgi:hypothetical protein